MAGLATPLKRLHDDDLFVDLTRYLDLQNAGKTSSPIDNTLSPTWGDSAAQVLSSGGELCLLVYDSDWPDADDSIDGSCWQGDDAVVAWVRLGSYNSELYSGYAQLSVSIEPNF